MPDSNEDKVYQRIGEFVVAFQGLENHLREIGWFILDPRRSDWPPKRLRKEESAELLAKVERLFLDALPKCRLDQELENDFRARFPEYAARFHSLRRTRNKILHSAFIKLRMGGEMHALMRSDPKLNTDDETGELLFDQEMLTEKSFECEFKEMADLGMFFNRCYLQLIQRYRV